VSDKPNVHCDTHGSQQETFVCEHVLEGWRAKTCVGFHAVPDSENPRPDAWCTACEQVFQEIGGDWENAPEREPKIRLICGACYDQAKRFHLNQIF